MTTLNYTLGLLFWGLIIIGVSVYKITYHFTQDWELAFQATCLVGLFYMVLIVYLSCILKELENITAAVKSKP